MAFLPGLFERKSAAERRATTHAVSASPSAYSGGTYASGGVWDTDKAIHSAYEKVIWVFRCVDAIASNQSSIPMYVRKGNADAGFMDFNPKITKLLNVRPNKYESADMFRYRMSSLALLSRRGVFIEVVGKPTDPDSLHLIPPGTCEPIPDPQTFVSGYRVRGEGMQEQILKPEQVIWIRLKPHPTDPYSQMTPLVTAGIAAETDFFARLFNRNFLMNDGRPGLLVTVQGAISPEDAAELKRRFDGGGSNAGKTSVIESDGIEVADLGANPRDVQWQEATRVSKEDILLSFGVPESILGNASGRTFDNADAEYEIFWTHTMLTHCRALANGLDALTGVDDDDRVIVYDFSGVDVLQRQQRRREEKLLTEFNNGLVSFNEYRKGTGKKTINTLAANVFTLPSGLVVAPEGTDSKTLIELVTVTEIATPEMPGGDSGGFGGFGGGSGGGGGPSPLQARAQQFSYQGAVQGSLAGARELNNVLSARALMLAGKLHKPFMLESKQQQQVVPGEVIETKEHPYHDMRTKTEATLQGVMLSWGNRQAQIVADRLTHSKVRKGTRHWEGETKATRSLDPTYVVEVDRWADDMRSDFKNVLLPVMKREAQRVARDMEKNGVLQALNDQGIGSGKGRTAWHRITDSANQREKIMDAALNPILDIVEKSTRRQSERIADTIQQMDTDGKSLPEIQQAVRNLINEQSSWHKGLTTSATTAAYEGIKNEVYGLGGDYITKTWNSVSDEQVRMSHREVDGDTVAAHDPFVVGKAAMMFPGDPFGPIEEVANCRCFLSFNFEGI